MRNRIFCSIDTPDVDRAVDLAREVAAQTGGIKLGLEFFNAQGPQGVRAVVKAVGKTLPLFLDLKYHDIPNTVAAAVRSISALAPAFINVHASGGADMMRAAREAAGKNIKVLGVTVLTSLDDGDLAAIGQSAPAGGQVERLAVLAKESGLDGVVCSALEIERVRTACGPDFILMVPGIRPKGSATHDQKRFRTPPEAIAAGADYLVIGRPITEAKNPAAAAAAIVQSLENTAAA